MSVPVLSRLSSARETASGRGNAAPGGAAAATRPLCPPPRLFAKARRRCASAASAGIRRVPASATRFPCSALRANPFSEGTDPFCRLPLPTLSRLTRGFSPWRPDAVLGTIGRETGGRRPDFRGRAGAHRTPQPVRRSASLPCPLAERIHSRARALSKRKDNSFRSPGARLWSPLRRRALPRPGARMLTRFSFGGLPGRARPCFPFGMRLRID